MLFETLLNLLFISGTIILGDFAPSCGCLAGGSKFNAAPFTAQQTGCNGAAGVGTAGATGGGDVCASNRVVAVGMGVQVLERTEAWDPSPGIFDYNAKFGTPTLSPRMPVVLDIVCGAPTVVNSVASQPASSTTVTRTAIPADDSTPSAWARYNVTGVVHLYVPGESSI